MNANPTTEQSIGSPALHPYWCDHCGGKAAFTIPGCPIDHTRSCERHGEDATVVYRAAVEYVRRTGKGIP